MYLLLKSIKKLGIDRTEYISKSVKQKVDKILDIGCGYGSQLGALRKKSNELWGIDMDEEILSEAKKSYPGVNFILQSATNIQFESNKFDVVILSEVIEHVGDKNKIAVINEAWRVLKPGGLFLFTAPYNGIFSWLDHLDFKRKFTYIYRSYMRFSKYKPRTPIVIGHKHLSLNEISKLFNKKFEIENIEFSGLFMSIINWILVIGRRLNLFPNSFINFLNKLQSWESGIRYPRFIAFNIRIRAYKITEGKKSNFLLN